MLRFAVRRIMLMIPVLFGLSVLLFAWLREGAARGHSFKIAHAPKSLLSLAGLYGVTELLPLA